MNFITALGVTTLLILLVVGFLYWVKFLFKKLFPNFSFWFKYKVLRMKYKDAEVKRLMECLDRDMSKEEVTKFFLLGGINKKKVRELNYIYQELIKLKGGKKK